MDSRFKQIWQKWKFELIALFLVLVGGFLLVEPFRLRGLFWQLLRNLLVAFFRGLENGIRRIVQFSLSDMLGILLLTVAIALVLWRVRYHLQRSPYWTSTRCPACGKPLQREHRGAVARFVSRIIPIRSYYCRNEDCGWEGWRVKPADPDE